MKDCIKSKFTKDTLFFMFPSSFFSIFGFLFFFFMGIKKHLIDTIDISRLFWGSLLCIGFPIFYIHTLKFRYYIIYKERLKFFSFWCPFGKVLYFKDYIGKVIQVETGIGGSYEVVYLVDKRGRTAFKLMGLHYKNFEEINDAIPLKKIKFSPTKGQYFKLLATGKMKIPKKDSKA